MELPAGQSPKKLWGIFTRKERWGLSWRGWLLATSAVLLAVAFLLLRIHPFLAVTHHLDTGILVVEGWIEPYAIRAAAEEFKTGAYQYVFTTGGPEPGSGGYTTGFDTAANRGAGDMRRAGVPTNCVQMVPSRVSGRDRTYSSAVALRDWFHEHNLPIRRINVLTEDAHARRTRLLFQKAFGKDVQVGIISVANPDYDATHWWRYSEGVREVIGETIAYLYAKLLFHP